MALELTGKIIKVLAPVTGEGKNGPWKKQEFVIEFSEGQYAKKVCLAAWGERVDNLNRYKIGDTITASISLESREYNERWFTEARAWKITGGEGNSSTSNDTYTQQPAAAQPTFNAEPLPQASSADDDLPF